MEKLTKSERQKAQTPSLHYTLFAYREELRRNDSKFIKKSALKLHLTDNLINKTISNIRSCDTSELSILSREITFKRNLYQKIRKVRKLEKLGLSYDPKPEQNEQKWY